MTNALRRFYTSMYSLLHNRVPGILGHKPLHALGFVRHVLRYVHVAAVSPAGTPRILGDPVLLPRTLVLPITNDGHGVVEHVACAWLSPGVDASFIVCEGWIVSIEQDGDRLLDNLLSQCSLVLSRQEIVGLNPDGLTDVAGMAAAGLRRVSAVFLLRGDSSVLLHIFECLLQGAAAAFFGGAVHDLLLRQL